MSGKTKPVRQKQPKLHYEQIPKLFVIPAEEEYEYYQISKSKGVDHSSHIAGDKDLCLAFFDYLWPYAYPRFNKLGYPTKIVRYLAKEGIINTAHLLEKAISKKGNIIRDQTHGRDFADGSDAKSVSVRLHSGDTNYGACIASIKAKQGTLRILVYERVFKKWYHFLIPHNEYVDRNYIAIPFTMNGHPDRSNYWWKFEVLSFKELCRPV